jgi:gelsolin
MQKAKLYNVADSNIANLGSDLEKKVKLEASQHEDAWKGAGQSIGLQIWRIQQFKVIAVPKNAYGSFHTGDSYIVLNTYKPKPDSPKLAYDVHFWLGSYTTQDEAGTAAYKTVELDDFLGGAPIQYREVQGYESGRFLSYFKGGIRLLEGGVETGFHHVEAEKYRPRLLHLKGKKQIRVHEVPLSYKSLNQGDVFVLDAGKIVIQWNGSKAGILEKVKAAELLQAIEGEREGKASGRVVSESEDDAEFFKILGDKGPIADASAGGSDLEADKKDTPAVLLRLSDATGKFEFTEVAKGRKVKRNFLDSNDVFVLFTGAEVFAWVGKKASVGEKKKALSFAQDYVLKAGLPPHTPVARILEGGENEIFEDFFD